MLTPSFRMNVSFVSTNYGPPRHGRVDWKAVHCVVCLLILVEGLATADDRPKEEEGYADSPAADQRNTGTVADLDLLRKPQVLWKYKAAGSNFADIVAFGGTAIALDRSGAIHALDSMTGRLLWKSKAGYEFSFGFGLALTCDPEFDVLLVGCDTGLFAVDRKTGKTIWRTVMPKGVAGPTCTKDTVFSGGADGNVYACDLRTGKVKWKHDYVSDRPKDPEGFDGERARFPGRAARPMHAATDGETVFLSVFDQCRTLAIDAKTGKRRWAFPTKGWMYGRPAVGERGVFVGSQDDHFYSIGKGMGNQFWKVKTKSRNEAAAAVAKNLVIFGSCDGNVYAVNKDMGNVVWQFETEKGGRAGAPIYSQPLISHETVYLAAMRGKIYALELKTGKLKWKFEPLADSEINSNLQVDAGRLFLTTRRDDGKGESAVMAIGSR
ncbi:MAG: PQQ-binding-like beta-propeller repeat protein [Planctomycetes bacterium]|nr:PQQ-binding-like beta-propeller repeat protein [Planctomycetota bacterium]